MRKVTIMRPCPEVPGGPQAGPCATLGPAGGRAPPIWVPWVLSGWSWSQKGPLYFLGVLQKRTMAKKDVNVITNISRYMKKNRYFLQTV